jgi:ABC-2 type transport system permease protein
VLREALDLWNNPRARLLVAVPFVLAILLKVLSGRALVVFFAGDAADAWLVSSLCLYGSVVMGATFSQNAFAYDGHGFATFLTAPLDLGLVLRAKNLVHASAGALLALVVALFYGLYFRAGSWLDVGCALAGVAALLPVLLMVGNLLSVFFPVKYHANLKRRDRVPLLASMLGVGGAALGSAPLGLVLRALHGQPPDARAVAVVLAAAAAAWFAYWSSLPAATRLLERRRELVLRAVSRD